MSEGSFTRWQDKRIPLEGSITGAAVTAGDIVIVADPATDDRTKTTGPDAVGVVGQSIAVPLRGDRGTSGVLILARGPGEPDFDTLDIQIIRGTSAHAGLALELAQVRRDQEALLVLQERADVADDMRDHVISSLFGPALDMQVTASKSIRPEVSEAIQRHVETTDKNHQRGSGCGVPAQTVRAPAGFRQRRQLRCLQPHLRLANARRAESRAADCHTAPCRLPALIPQ